MLLKKGNDRTVLALLSLTSVVSSVTRFPFVADIPEVPFP